VLRSTKVSGSWGCAVRRGMIAQAETAVVLPFCIQSRHLQLRLKIDQAALCVAHPQDPVTLLAPAKLDTGPTGGKSRPLESAALPSRLSARPLPRLQLGIDRIARSVRFARLILQISLKKIVQ
jgi:hypothetical protein